MQDADQNSPAARSSAGVALTCLASATEQLYFATFAYALPDARTGIRLVKNIVNPFNRTSSKRFPESCDGRHVLLVDTCRIHLSSGPRSLLWPRMLRARSMT